jgi:hypothetical protein
MVRRDVGYTFRMPHNRHVVKQSRAAEPEELVKALRTTAGRLRREVADLTCAIEMYAVVLGSHADASRLPEARRARKCNP